MIVLKYVKKYGKHKALDELSLQVKPGEIMALVGPNGAGKTTLIKCIVGLLHNDSGNFQYMEKLLHLKQKTILLIFQMISSYING